MRTVWGIRHLRYLYWRIRWTYRAKLFLAVHKLGDGTPTAEDEAVLDAIWHGEA